MSLVILDVNPHLHIIEEIFNRYMFIEDEELLRFVCGLRYPLGWIPKMPISNTGDISNKPFYPYKSIDLFCRILTHEIYSNSEHYVDYLGNNALANSSKCKSRSLFKDNDKDLTEIILEYIPNISLPDRDAIINTVNLFINSNYNIIASLRNHVVEYETKGEFLVIKNLGHIHSYRYMEAVDGNKQRSL